MVAVAKKLFSTSVFTGGGGETLTLSIMSFSRVRWPDFYWDLDLDPNLDADPDSNLDSDVDSYCVDTDSTLCLKKNKTLNSCP